MASMTGVRLSFRRRRARPFGAFHPATERTKGTVLSHFLLVNWNGTGGRNQTYTPLGTAFWVEPESHKYLEYSDNILTPEILCKDLCKFLSAFVGCVSTGREKCITRAPKSRSERASLVSVFGSVKLYQSRDHLSGYETERYNVKASMVNLYFFITLSRQHLWTIGYQNFYILLTILQWILKRKLYLK